MRRVVRINSDVIFNQIKLAYTNRSSLAPATIIEQPTPPTDSKNEGPIIRSRARRTANAKANAKAKAKATISETVKVAKPISDRSTGIAVIMLTRD